MVVKENLTAIFILMLSVWCCYNFINVINGNKHDLAKSEVLISVLRVLGGLRAKNVEEYLNLLIWMGRKV